MKDTRHFAVEVMNRAGLAFDAPDVARAGKVIEQLEADLAAWLEQQLRAVVIVDDVIAAVRSGQWRQGEIPPCPDRRHWSGSIPGTFSQHCVIVLFCARLVRNGLRLY